MNKGKGKNKRMTIAYDFHKHIKHAYKTAAPSHQRTLQTTVPPPALASAYEEYKKVEQAYCEYFTSVLSQPLGICSTGTYSAGDTTTCNPQWVYLS